MKIEKLEMFLLLCFILIIPLSLSQDDEEETEEKGFQCEVGLTRKRRFLPLLAGLVGPAIGPIVKTVASVVTNSDAASGLMGGASKAMSALQPVANMVGKFAPGIAPLAGAVGQVADMVTGGQQAAAPEAQAQAQAQGQAPVQQQQANAQAAQNEAEFRRLSDEQQGQVKDIAQGQLKTLTETSKKQDEKYESLNRQQTDELNNVTSQQMEQVKNLSKQQEKQHKVSKKLLEENQKFAKDETARFKNFSEAQNKEYNLSLQQLGTLDSISDAGAKNFANLSQSMQEVYNTSLEQVKELETISENQKQHVEKLSNQMEEMHQKQTELAESVSEQIVTFNEDSSQQFNKFSEEQTKHVEELSSNLEDLNNQQIEQFGHLAEQQRQIFNNMSDELRTIAQFADVEKDQLKTLSKLVSDGFTQIQEHMDERFDKLEEMLTKMKEMTIFLDYETKVQKRLREVYDAYMLFIKSMANVTDDRGTNVALRHLVKKCCANIPFEIMGTLYQKTIGKTMQLTDMFSSIYEQYFGKDSKRMLTLYGYILDDVFRTIQMVTICDEVTKGSGLGVDTATDQGKKVAERLDALTSKMEQEALNVLVHQSPVVDEIIKEWRDMKKPFPSDMGCSAHEIDGEFPSFAVRSLQKKYHFFKFFVTVVTYDSSAALKANKTNYDVWCKTHKTHFFRYIKKHSKEYGSAMGTNASEDYNDRMNKRSSFQRRASEVDSKNKWTVTDCTHDDCTKVRFTKCKIEPENNQNVSKCSCIEGFTKRDSACEPKDGEQKPNKFDNENILLLVSFLPGNTTIDPSCIDKLKIFCKSTETGDLPVPETKARNGIVCEVPYHVDVCGIAWAEFPNTMRRCFKNPYSFMLATCY